MRGTETPESGHHRVNTCHPADLDNVCGVMNQLYDPLGHRHRFCDGVGCGKKIIPILTYDHSVFSLDKRC